MTGAGRIALAVLVAVTTWFVPAQHAAAACAGAQQASPYVFTGKVDRVELDGQKAFVTTADGRDVVVLGDRPASAEPRTYTVGETYEFHPLNDSTPYQDNACTATRAVGDHRFTGPGVLVLALIAGMVFSAPSLARWIRRRYGSPPPSPRSDGPGEPSA